MFLVKPWGLRSFFACRPLLNHFHIFVHLSLLARCLQLGAEIGGLFETVDYEEYIETNLGYVVR